MSTLALEAITFDLDNTLWDNHEVMERTETGHYDWLDAALLDWLARRGDSAVMSFAERFPPAIYRERREALAHQYPQRRGDFSWLRERALFSLLEEYGLPRSSALLWAILAMQHFLVLRHRVTPHPEVEAMLDTLSRRYRLASITNGNVDIRRLGWQRHFPVAIAAGEILAPKPDPRPFRLALERLGARPSQALHVGDSWEEDVLPAQRLGMQVAWIAGADSGLPPGIHRLAHIRELPELIAWLERQG